MAAHISLEAYVGVVIAVVIIKAGLEMMSDTVNDILGQRADTALSKKIKRMISDEPEVRGAYDLVINNYGPDRNIGSVHLELPDDMTVEQVDELTRRVEAKVFKETGVALTGVGVYSYNTKDDEASHIRMKVSEIVTSHDYAIQMHGFYVDMKEKTMRFDMVISFEKNAEEALSEVYMEVKKAFPDYQIEITPDRDISD